MVVEVFSKMGVMGGGGVGVPVGVTGISGLEDPVSSTRGSDFVGDSTEGLTLSLFPVSWWSFCRDRKLYGVCGGGVGVLAGGAPSSFSTISLVSDPVSGCWSISMSTISGLISDP